MIIFSPMTLMFMTIFQDNIENLTAPKFLAFPRNHRNHRYNFLMCRSDPRIARRLIIIEAAWTKNAIIEV